MDDEEPCHRWAIGAGHPLSPLLRLNAVTAVCTGCGGSVEDGGGSTQSSFFQQSAIPILPVNVVGGMFRKSGSCLETTGLLEEVGELEILPLMNSLLERFAEVDCFSYGQTMQDATREHRRSFQCAAIMKSLQGGGSIKLGGYLITSSYTSSSDNLQDKFASAIAGLAVGVLHNLS
ncbi:hypothetical protein GJ496_006188 [Pomphorhynchus laevis]|nr:hypothetical protein GJ496_006188 [Pomphorhynchus laevis]